MGADKATQFWAICIIVLIAVIWVNRWLVSDSMEVCLEKFSKSTCIYTLR